MSNPAELILAILFGDQETPGACADAPLTPNREDDLEQIAAKERRYQEWFQQRTVEVDAERRRFYQRGWDSWISSSGPDYNAGACTITRSDKGFIDPRNLIQLPGARGEGTLFAGSPYGRMVRSEWNDKLESVRRHGVVSAVLVAIEKGGTVHIYEGNHRVRLALAAGCPDVPVEFRYFGNAHYRGLVWDSHKNAPGSCFSGPLDIRRSA